MVSEELLVKQREDEGGAGLFIVGKQITGTKFYCAKDDVSLLAVELRLYGPARVRRSLS